ncbi:MAG: hypothetical protein ACP5IE_05265, partial [Infirmifilum sp.]
YAVTSVGTLHSNSSYYVDNAGQFNISVCALNSVQQNGAPKRASFNLSLTFYNRSVLGLFTPPRTLISNGSDRAVWDGYSAGPLENLSILRLPYMRGLTSSQTRVDVYPTLFSMNSLVIGAKGMLHLYLGYARTLVLFSALGCALVILLLVCSIRKDEKGRSS